MTTLSGLQDGLKRSKAEGRPLPHGIRREMEEGFGEDFSNVRIHTGSRSTSMNRSIHAKAFTHEHNIFFNEARVGWVERSETHQWTADGYADG